MTEPAVNFFELVEERFGKTLASGVLALALTALVVVSISSIVVPIYAVLNEWGVKPFAEFFATYMVPAILVWALMVLGSNYAINFLHSRWTKKLDRRIQEGKDEKFESWKAGLITEMKQEVMGTADKHKELFALSARVTAYKTSFDLIQKAIATSEGNLSLGIFYLQQSAKHLNELAEEAEAKLNSELADAPTDWNSSNSEAPDSSD